MCERIISDTFALTICHGSIMDRKWVKLYQRSLIRFKHLGGLRDDPESMRTLGNSVDLIFVGGMFQIEPYV
ncbi:hypothetical protein SLIQ_22540 [Serratia liquefaciens FK01]|nr:hypothetical protein SLIQ_22540 [Serratia liquefaciens FK01]